MSVSVTNDHSANATKAEASDLHEAVLRANTTNPALQRLQSRMRAVTQAGEVITSYDRMHHRHNRS